MLDCVSNYSSKYQKNVVKHDEFSEYQRNILRGKFDLKKRNISQIDPKYLDESLYNDCVFFGNLIVYF